MSVIETPARSERGIRHVQDPPPRSTSLSKTIHTAMKTPQSKYGPSVLISATATRINGRIASTPRAADAAPCTLSAREKRRNTVTDETPSKAPTFLKSTYSSGRRLPMNMVVSQVASRRVASPVKELHERLITEELPPPLDPLLDHLLNFTTPGSKTGSLPHPDDLMGAKARKFRRIEGPEDEIHKAFVSIYGDAEAGLSAEKKLRLSRNSKSEDCVISEACGRSINLHRPEYEQLVTTQHSACEYDSSIHVPPATDGSAYYRELYGVAPRSSAAVAVRASIPNSPSEIWKSREASPPPRKFVSSHNFLKTASDVYSEQINYKNTSYCDPPQESTWEKYMNNENKEEKNPWVTESLGKSNQENYGTCDFQFNPYISLYSSKDDFKFMPRSPAKPGPSPTLGQNMSREQTKARKQGGSSGLPESAECRWLYAVSPQRDVAPRHGYEDNDREDDEIVNQMQADKESLFSSTPTECSGENNKADFYNYSSEE